MKRALLALVLVCSAAAAQSRLGFSDLLARLSVTTFEWYTDHDHRVWTFTVASPSRDGTTGAFVAHLYAPKGKRYLNGVLLVYRGATSDETAPAQVRQLVRAVNRDCFAATVPGTEALIAWVNRTVGLSVAAGQGRFQKHFGPLTATTSYGRSFFDPLDGRPRVVVGLARAGSPGKDGWKSYCTAS